MQFGERADWIPSFNIAYILGVDGLSLPMVVLTGMLFYRSFRQLEYKKSCKRLFCSFLMLNTGVREFFLSLDFFFFLYFLGGYVASNVFPYWNVGSVKENMQLLNFSFTPSLARFYVGWYFGIVFFMW